MILTLILLFVQCCSSQTTDMGPCSPNPCQNNVNCYVSGDTYRCSCGTGYKGDNCQYQVFVKGVVSTGKPAYQSATYSSDGISYHAGLAVDGDTNMDFNMGSCSRTVVSGNQNPYWYVDLGDLHSIGSIDIYITQESEVSNFGMEVYVVNSTDSPLDASNQYGSIDSTNTNNYFDKDVIGRFVFLLQQRSNEMTVCEVRVRGIPLSPALLCPDRDVVGSSPSNVTWDPPTVVDDVDLGLVATCTPPSGSSLTTDSTTVNCAVTDSTGLTGTCTFTIKLILVDNEDPNVVCPGDKNVNTRTGQATVIWNDPSVSDNVDTGLSATCTPPSGSLFNIASTNISCSATDSAGNTGNCEFTVYFVNNIKPTMSCPNDIKKDTTTDKTSVRWEPSDHSPGLSPTCTPPSGSLLGVGTTDVTCTVTDWSGNSKICAFKVTVHHITNPNVVCPDDKTSFTDSTQVTVTWNDPSVIDNVDTGLSANCTPPSGSSFNAGSTNVTCTAMDTDSNTGSCQFTVFVIDIGVPVVTCPSNKEEDTDKDQVTMTWNDPSVTDNIDTGLSATCTPPSGSLFNIGSTVVTCTAMDTTGNTGSCGFNVTINDSADPEVDCPDDFKVYTITDQVTVTWDDPSVGDNVDTGLSATCTPSSGSSFNIGSTDVTCSATDTAGNTGSCEFNVTVNGYSAVPGYLIAILIVLVVIILVMFPVLVFYCRFYSSPKKTKMDNSAANKMTNFDNALMTTTKIEDDEDDYEGYMVPTCNMVPTDNCYVQEPEKNIASVYENIKCSQKY